MCATSVQGGNAGRAVGDVYRPHEGVRHVRPPDTLPRLSVNSMWTFVGQEGSRPKPYRVARVTVPASMACERCGRDRHRSSYDSGCGLTLQ